MRLALAARLARREMRGGIRGFTVLLLCLALGVAAIAAVGTVRGSIGRAIAEQGAVLLGGDAQMSFTYREASADELDFMARRADKVSAIVDFRSMAVIGEGEASDRALTQVKAVDDAYPLTGAVELDPAIPLAEALDPADGLPGAVMDGVLMDRLGLAVGDRFRLGTAEFRVAARLVREPDSATGGFSLGPRTIVRTDDLAESGLIGPGSLYETRYRLTLPAGTNLAQVKAAAERQFLDTGMRWQDSRNGAPGAERFVDRLGSFLVLVGLAGLAVGGIGVASAVRSYLESRIETIAALKAMGAESGTIFALYLIQIGILAACGIVAGLLIGVGGPILAGPLIAAQLPIPVAIGIEWRPLAEAALYGALAAALFAYWPLARTREVRAAALFRDIGADRRLWPGGRTLAVLATLAGLLIAAALLLAEARWLAMWTLGGVAAALAVLWLAALVTRTIANRAGRRLRRWPGLRLALAAIGGPRDEATAVILSLGLGLSVLAAMSQIDANLRAAIARDLPEIAPSYFFVDIQNDQIDGFLARLDAHPEVRKVDYAAMLRGVLTRINGQDAREVAGGHWVVRGDRGITYAETPPSGTEIVAGEWWPEGYDGPPQMSFAREEAEEIGVGLGDKVTVNILGRDIEATITSLREVDFSTAGIGFVMSLNPAALKGAPHTFIATVYADTASEAAILRELAEAYPNITAIRVRDAIDRVSEAMQAIARATAIAAGVTLITGFVVLIGAAASGERSRAYEAAILKTLGATRGRILASFALRSALMGAAAGGVAIAFGAAAAWAVMTFIMEAEFGFEPVSAIVTVVGGAAASLLAGLAFALRPLARSPASVLRARD